MPCSLDAVVEHDGKIAHFGLDAGPAGIAHSAHDARGAASDGKNYAMTDAAWPDAGFQGRQGVQDSAARCRERLAGKEHVRV